MECQAAFLSLLMHPNAPFPYHCFCPLTLSSNSSSSHPLTFLPSTPSFPPRTLPLPVLQELLSAGADLTIPNRASESPMYIAALRGHAEVLQLLTWHCDAYGIDWTHPDMHRHGEREDAADEWHGRRPRSSSSMHVILWEKCVHHCHPLIVYLPDLFLRPRRPLLFMAQTGARTPLGTNPRCIR